MEIVTILLGGTVLIALLLLYSSFAWGFVFYKFYNWFLLPVFAKFLPVITYHEAVGIMLVVGLFNIGTGSNEKKDKGVIVGSLLLPWITLLVAVFIRLFL